jgi:diguanylate cyclase (GGDEF)-like protein
LQTKTLKLLCETSRQILEEYIAEHANGAVVLLNREYRLLDCNLGFLRILSLSEKPRKLHLKEFLLPESDKVLRQFPASGGRREMRLNLRGESAFVHTISCQVYGTEWGYIVFGDKPLATSSEVVDKISILNSEMANLSRELQQKNRALEQANATITQLMRTDPLTGLANRRFFMEILIKEISLARRHGVPLSLVMADLDYFKNINDACGHDGGDEVLKAFAALLQEHTRKEDLAARFGGEEFMLILPHTSDLLAEVMAERIRRRLETLTIPKINRQVTSSFGVAQIAPADDPHTLIKRADEALYQAKAWGRNRVMVNAGNA